MNYRTSALVTSALLILPASCSSDDETPTAVEAASLTSFTVSRSTVQFGQQVEFRWEINNPGTSQVTCTVDAQSDGIVDYEFPDCVGEASQQHVYENGGAQICTLTISTEGVGSDSRELAVAVDGPSLLINAPTTQFVAGNTLDLSVGVDTQIDVSTVVASIEDQEVALEFTGTSASETHKLTFAGVLDLTELAEGHKVLEVTMIDALETEVRVFQSISYDRPPELVLTLPTALAIAQPEILVEAQCTDNTPGPCELIVTVGPFEVGKGEETLSQFVDLSQFDGRKIQLNVTARDAAGQRTRKSLDVYVESSPLLEQVMTLPSEIVDFDGERVLYQKAIAGGFELTLLDGEGVTHTVPAPEGTSITDTSSAFLTPTGVIYRAANNRIFDWRLGLLEDLGGGSSIQTVAGDYAAWETGPDAALRHFPSGSLDKTTILQGFSKEAYGNLAATDGGTVTFQYYNPVPTVSRIVGGVVESLHEGRRPASDGSTYVFVDAPHPPRQILLWKDNLVEVLHEGGSVNLEGRDYQVNNGWVVYRRDGSVDQRVLWRRDPEGVDAQVSVSLDDSDIDCLGPDGRVTFTSQDRRYLADTEGNLIDIGSDLGYSSHVGGEIYVVIGHTILRLIE